MQCNIFKKKCYTYKNAAPQQKNHTNLKEFTMNAFLNLNKAFIETLTKANAQALEQFQTVAKQYSTTTPADIQKSIEQATQTAKAQIKAATEQVLAVQESVHNQVIEQLEKFENDATSPLISQYKTAVTAYKNAVLDGLDKLVA